MNRDISTLEKKIIYLDKNAPRGGDGTAAKPYRCFSCAFDAAKHLLSSLSEPAHVVLDVKGGNYTLSETLTLSGKDMPVFGSHFTLRGDGNVTLSSLEEIPAVDFTASNRENIYNVTLLNKDGTPLIMSLWSSPWAVIPRIRAPRICLSAM